jgi:hypothetical protein
LPGIIPLLTTTLDESMEAWKFVALVVMPYHFDPFSFKLWKLFFLPVLFCFNWVHFRAERKDYALQFVIYFQAFLGLFFVLGFLARFTDNYVVLKLMPCRMFPVLLPLFFFFHLMSTLQRCRLMSGKSLVPAVLLVLVIIGIPSKLLVDHIKVSRQDDQFTQDEKDAEQALRWIAKNTPTDSVLILPPWRKDSFYLSSRAQIANWWVLRFDRLTEWRERLEAVAGDLSHVADGTEKAKMTQTVYYYNHLTATDIAVLQKNYGADYLLSSTSYSYPVLLSSGTYKVYSLPSAGQR